LGLLFTVKKNYEQCSGIPVVYELDPELKPIKHYFTASDAEVKAAIDKVANQGKTK